MFKNIPKKFRIAASNKGDIISVNLSSITPGTVEINGDLHVV